MSPVNYLRGVTCATCGRHVTKVHCGDCQPPRIDTDGLLDWAEALLVSAESKRSEWLWQNSADAFIDELGVHKRRQEALAANTARADASHGERL